MLVTTKGRYALRMMVNIAGYDPDTKIALRKVAEEEDISLKYPEQLAHSMVLAGLLSSARGHGDGYALAKPATEIKAGDILRAAEGVHHPVSCAGLDDECPRSKSCKTVAFWKGLDQAIEDYVNGTTLEDLAHPQQ